jgi:hypothetical protein
MYETTRILPGGQHVTEVDRSAYAWGTMFGRPYQDIWLVDVKTGQRTKALEKGPLLLRPQPEWKAPGVVRRHQLLEL